MGRVRGADAGIKPGLKRSETPGPGTKRKHRVREAAESGCDYKNTLIPLSAAPRGLDNFVDGSWGFAPLHPRLYAVAAPRVQRAVF